MTPEEYGERVNEALDARCHHPVGIRTDRDAWNCWGCTAEAVAIQVRAAVEEEREACARTLEEMAAEPERRGNFVAYGVMATLMLARDAAAAIRMRGQQ